MNAEPVRILQAVAAPAAEVYRAFTRSLALREWLCDGAALAARPGGHLYVWWHSGYYAAGEFTALTPEDRVAFTWQGRGEPGQTQVEVTFAQADAGSEITLTHAGFGAGEAWQKARRASLAGWTEGLANLKAVLETGQDLRYVLRPLLGIYVDEFTPEIAARLGVPVNEGTRLGGVVAGLGAEQAGLQRDDVIVSVAAQPAADYLSLVTLLGSRRAGEQLSVTFYRGNERRTVEMTLSHRPVPEVPATPAELAEAVRKANAAAFVGLASCLAGVTDELAARRPAAGEWNTLETLAHLIIHEREQQAWITDLLCDDERWSDRFENPEVVPARVEAVAGAYPRLADMLDALRRSQEETADMLAALPAAFVAHRGTYWRLGRSLMEATQPPSHMAEHTGQIRAALAAP